MRVVVIVLCLLTSIGVQANEGKDTQKRPSVAVQLNWFHQFEFAAFYAAIAQGYYDAAGIDVTIQEGGPGIDSVDIVVSGGAQFGVASASVVVERYRGKPIVVLGALLQHSSIALLARRDRGISSVNDLKGRKIQCPPHACDEISAFLKAFGLDPVKQSYAEPVSLIASERLEVVDATVVYIANEGFKLQGLEHQYILLLPRSVGIDLYGDVLFTSEAFLKSDPDLVERFRKATFEGLRYAMDHPTEVINEILVRYNSQKKSREHLTYEAEKLNDLIRADLVEPGYMSPGRWRHVRDTYAELDLVPPDYDMAGLFYDFDPAQKDIAALTTYVVISLSGALVLGSLAGYIFYLNRRLTRSVQALDAANIALQRLAHYDTLTGVPNRLLIGERGDQALHLAQRRGGRFALLMIDLDKFKPINDLHGHSLGDLVLKEVAVRIRSAIRKSDTVGRLGGDEFLVLLAEVDSSAGALIAAEKIRRMIEQPMKFDHLTLNVAACVGVAVYPEHGSSVDDLTRHSDAAMYFAKECGGDRAQLFSAEIMMGQFQKTPHQADHAAS